MILVASCPGGNISNFISSLAKGNTTLSIGLSAIATLSATFMTPLNFAFWGSLYTHFYNRNDAEALLRPLHIDSGQMFQTVFILLGIPLVLGLIFARRFPRLTVKIRGPIRKLSVGIFIAFVVIALAKNFEFFIQFIHLIFIIVLIHNALALVTGYSASSLMKLPQTDRRTIAIETGIQNSGLGLALIFNPKIFPPDMELGGMAIIAAWWGIWHIVSGLSLSWFWSRKPVTDEAEAEPLVNVHHHSHAEGK
jgi:BASS family bile acid:Na+ symporter